MEWYENVEGQSGAEIAAEERGEDAPPKDYTVYRCPDCRRFEAVRAVSGPWCLACGWAVFEEVTS